MRKDYQPYFVAYIDILGFKEIVNNLAPAAIASFRDRLRKGIRSSGIDRSNRMIRVKMFSDSLTMTAPAREYPLAIFLFSIGHFEVEMARRGFFLRGAVVHGDHYEDDRLLFGPALIKAVEFERTLALWPRIIVHPELALRDPYHPPEAPKYPPQWTLQKDSDGTSYIDYLSMALDDPGAHFIEQHKKQVEKQIQRNRAEFAVLAKYWWLANYHNRHVDAEELDERLKIDLSTPMDQALDHPG